MKESYDYRKLFDKAVYQFYSDKLNEDIQVEQQKDYHSILLCMMQSLFKKNYEQAFHDYIETVNFIKNYHQTEIAFYLYGISLLLTHQGYLKEAFDMISDIDLWAEGNMHLKMLLKKQRLVLAFEMNHHAYLVSEYQNTLKALLETESYHIVSEIKVYYYVYMARYLKLKRLKQLLENSNMKQPHFDSYVLAHYFYHQGDYEQTIRLLENQPLIQENHLSVLLKSMSKRNDYAKLNYYLTKDLSITSSDYKQFVKYIAIKAKQKESAIKYLQEEILHHKLLTDRYDLLMFWYEEVMMLLPSISFYKEATLFAQRIMRKLRQMRE